MSQSKTDKSFVYLLFGLWGGIAFADVYMSELLVRHGIVLEANPVMGFAMRHIGPWSAILPPVAAVALAAIMGDITSRRQKVAAYLCGVFAFAFTMAVYVRNWSQFLP